MNLAPLKYAIFIESLILILSHLANLHLLFPKVDLSKTYASPYTLGLIPTYYVNYVLSGRKTACLLKDVHGLNISHQTILNYADAVSNS